MKFSNSLIFFLVCFFLYIHASLAMNSEENERELGKGIAQRCGVEKDKIKVTTLSPKGSGNNGIYEIRIGEDFYIGKALIDLTNSGEGTREEQIEKYVQLNAEIIPSLNGAENFPRFAKYVDSFKTILDNKEEQILVLEKAKGVSLIEFGETTGIADEEMKHHLKQIGTVLGNFHSQSWSHGDFKSGSDNIFYDPSTSVVTLIDYGELENEYGKAEHTKFLSFVYRYFKNIFKNQDLKNCFFDSYMNMFKKETEKVRFKELVLEFFPGE